VRALDFGPPSGAAGTPLSGFSVGVARADRIEVAWGDGDTSVLPVNRGAVRLRHTYRRAGRFAIDVVAVGRCGERSVRSAPGRLRVTVGLPCRERRGDDLDMAMCDGVRGSLRAEAGRSATRSVWLTAPCRDVVSGQVIEPEPVARTAACAAPETPYPVPGAVRPRPGGVVTLRLAGPARSIRVRVGTPNRPVRDLGTLRPTNAAGRTFRVRIPLDVPPSLSRLYVGARGEEWLVGLQVRR